MTLPFFVLHGEADTVTDPEVSRALYQRASTTDKTMKLYPGMWHGLTAGEPDENIEVVFSDIISWLDTRADVEPAATNSHLSTKGAEVVVANAARSLLRDGPRKPQRGRSRMSYLCGLKGQSLCHHSAT